MSSLEFVFEKPHKAPKATKKRTRLITACDSCRTRKLKCRPSKTGKDVCESCSQSGTACEFTERDNIRAQRGIASFSVKPEKANRKTAKNLQLVTRFELSSPPSFEPYRKPEPSYSVPNVDFSSRNSIPSFPSSPPGSANAYYGVPSGWNIVSSRSLYLFDPSRPSYPHPHLLSHLTVIFFEYARGIFNFLDEEDIVNRVHNATLSALLANCIAAYSIRFYDNHHHSPGARHLSSAPFVDTAKLLISENKTPKFELVQCLIILAWVENGTGAMDSSWSYSRYATTVAMDLKLDSEESIVLDPSLKKRDQMRRMFWAIAWLDLLSCSVVSRVPLINLDSCTTSMPSPEILYIESLSRQHTYDALKSVLSIMAKLYAVSNAGRPNVPSAARDQGLLRLQEVMVGFRDRLPQTMDFSMANLRHADVLREGYYFHVTHALVHSMVVVLHCPALFWASQSGTGPPPLPRMDVAWLSIIKLVDIFILGGKNNHRLPVAINSFSVPLGIARGALMLAQKHAVHTMSSVGLSEDAFFRISQSYLSETLRLIMELSTYWASVHQVKIASEPVTLYGSNMKQDSNLFFGKSADSDSGPCS
ncbi:hypothetical protein SCHPADRAFT_876003 [Schizopora paradoxa]|uniref:Zn(2)-C6 fungal-type domain-containing protein n=1 Tax=Schizopora paradoxa TaxID=27342 RepID=A0A0H2RJG2_9AGAM|nr:hypothetical protein SCHPADRAFT_876003 [Schizopora paradoxa]